ncbi:MAG TPA: hypothetical protein VLI92_01825 [Candidatus Saccharimonadales bacterium]|nr:hypothetical protein [Candidatus Saccharimonadales bacterium]
MLVFSAGIIIGGLCGFFAGVATLHEVLKSNGWIIGAIKDFRSSIYPRDNLAEWFNGLPVYRRLLILYYARWPNSIMDVDHKMYPEADPVLKALAASLKID